MLSIISLFDGGQNYIDFLIEDSFILRSFPNASPGWQGTRVLNREFIPGRPLRVQFTNGYDMALPYLITTVTGPF